MLSYESYMSFLPPAMRGRAMEWFDYNQDQLALATGTSASSNITIQNDADFLVASAVCRVNLAADVSSVLVDPPITSIVTDTSSGQQWQSRPVALSTFFALTGTAAGGVAGLSGMLPFPRVVKAGGTISTTFAHLGVIAAVDVRYTYRGIKIYYFERGV